MVGEIVVETVGGMPVIKELPRHARISLEMIAQGDTEFFKVVGRVVRLETAAVSAEYEFQWFEGAAGVFRLVRVDEALTYVG